MTLRIWQWLLLLLILLIVLCLFSILSYYWTITDSYAAMHPTPWVIEWERSYITIVVVEVERVITATPAPTGTPTITLTPMPTFTSTPTPTLTPTATPSITEKPKAVMQTQVPKKRPWWDRLEIRCGPHG